MDVLRKSLSLTVALSLILSTIPKTTFADEPRHEVKRTPFAVDKDKINFCESAPVKMKKLNEANEPKLAKLDALKEQIVDLNSQMALLNSLSAFKNQYQGGLQELANAATPQAKSANKQQQLQNLDSMKKVIRNGLILNAVGLLLKNGDLDKDDAFSIGTICSKNSDQEICSKEEKFSTIKTAGQPLVQQQRHYRSAWWDLHPLDETLRQIKDAYKGIKAGNRQALNEKMQKILDSIPADIAPDAILQILDKTAPGITKILVTDVAKSNLSKCLDEKTTDDTRKACDALLPALAPKIDPVTKQPLKNFLERMNEETSNALAGMEGLREVINTTAKSNFETLQKDIENHDRLVQGPVQLAQSKTSQLLQKPMAAITQTSSDISEAADKKRRQASKVRNELEQRKVYEDADNEMTFANLGMAQLFLKPTSKDMPQSIYESNKLNSVSLKNAKALHKEWTEKCTGTTPDLTFCQELSPVIENNLNSIKINFETKLKDLQNELSKVTEGNFAAVESMKKFVAEKYLRSCVADQPLNFSTQDYSLGIAVDGHCYQSQQKLNTLTNLSSDVNNIIAETRFALDLKKADQNKKAFDAEEMSGFTKACATETGKEFPEVCADVKKEEVVTSIRVQNEEEEREVKENRVNDDKDYWVTSNGHGGFNKVSKKSNLRIIGEGVLPVAPQMIPMFFGNYAMRANITSLTDQALYQKQMLYNYNLYNTSPWLYNYGTNGVFSGYGNPFSTTTTGTTTTGVTSTAGFGF